MQAAGYAQGKAEGKGKGKNKEDRGRAPARIRLGRPGKRCCKEKGKGRGTQGVYGVDDGEAEGAGDEAPGYFGDMDLCAAADVMEACTWQTGAGFLAVRPPGLIDADTFDPWQRTWIQSLRRPA